MTPSRALVQTRPPRAEHEGFSDVLSSARRGDDWAWETLYRDLAGPIVGYLATRGATDPEGLAAEVFLNVARDIGRFQGDESSFRSWVFVIAHRRLIDERRASRRYRR